MKKLIFGYGETGKAVEQFYIKNKTDYEIYDDNIPELDTDIINQLSEFDEVIISIFLSGGGNSTLTKQMFSALRDYIDPTIAAISTLMIILSTGLMLGLQLFGNTLARQKQP